MVQAVVVGGVGSLLLLGQGGTVDLGGELFVEEAFAVKALGELVYFLVQERDVFLAEGDVFPLLADVVVLLFGEFSAVLEEINM